MMSKEKISPDHMTDLSEEYKLLKDYAKKLGDPAPKEQAAIMRQAREFGCKQVSDMKDFVQPGSYYLKINCTDRGMDCTVLNSKLEELDSSELPEDVSAAVTNFFGGERMNVALMLAVLSQKEVGKKWCGVVHDWTAARMLSNVRKAREAGTLSKIDAWATLMSIRILSEFVESRFGNDEE